METIGSAQPLRTDLPPTPTTSHVLQNKQEETSVRLVTEVHTHLPMSLHRIVLKCGGIPCKRGKKLLSLFFKASRSKNNIGINQTCIELTERRASVPCTDRD